PTSKLRGTVVRQRPRRRYREESPTPQYLVNGLGDKLLLSNCRGRMPRIAPYGSWKSPITSDLIVAQFIALSETRLDGEEIYWLEGRPQEQGRSVVVRADGRGGRVTDITRKPYSARTRVHEYGGASWTVAGGVVYFSNFDDGRLYSIQAGTPRPRALTPAPGDRERQWRGCRGLLTPPPNRPGGRRREHHPRGGNAHTRATQSA